MKCGERLQWFVVLFISPGNSRARGHWLCGAPLKSWTFGNGAAALPVCH